MHPLMTAMMIGGGLVAADKVIKGRKRAQERAPEHAKVHELETTVQTGKNSKASMTPVSPEIAQPGEDITAGVQVPGVGEELTQPAVEEIIIQTIAENQNLSNMPYRLTR